MTDDVVREVYRARWRRSRKAKRLLREVCHVLANGTPYRDPDPDDLDQRHAHRVTRRPVELLGRHGYRVVREPVALEASGSKRHCSPRWHR